MEVHSETSSFNFPTHAVFDQLFVRATRKQFVGPRCHGRHGIRLTTARPGATWKVEIFRCRNVVCFFFVSLEGQNKKTCFTSFEKLTFFLFCEKVELFVFSGPTWNVHYLKQGIFKNLGLLSSFLKPILFFHPQAMAIPWQKPWELWAMPRVKELGSFHLKPRLRPLRPVHVVVYLGKDGKIWRCQKMRDVSENRGTVPPNHPF